MTEERHYTTNELAEAAGITYRQADHWSTLGILVPDPGEVGKGTLRTYPATEMLIARIIGRLSEAFGDRQENRLDRFRDLAHELRSTPNTDRMWYAPGVELDLDQLVRDGE